MCACVFICMHICLCMCVYACTYMHMCMFVCMWIMRREEELLREAGDCREQWNTHVMINQSGALTRGQEPASRRKRTRGGELTRTITPKCEDATKTPIVLYANSKSKKKGRKRKMHKKWATPRGMLGSQPYPLWCVSLGKSVIFLNLFFFYLCHL